MSCKKPDSKPKKKLHKRKYIAVTQGWSIVETNKKRVHKAIVEAMLKKTYPCNGYVFTAPVDENDEVHTHLMYVIPERRYETISPNDITWVSHWSLMPMDLMEKLEALFNAHVDTKTWECHFNPKAH